VASTIPPVLIELQLETARISAQMAEIKGDFDKFGQTVTKQNTFMEKFKANAAGMFAGNLMAQGFNMVGGAIKGAIEDAQTYEKQVAQLNAGIKSTGNVAGLSVEGLKAQASALESISSVDENLIMQSQAVFQTFTNIRNVVGKGNDIFNQASVAALDLSTKMGGDLQGATVQLGKALNDPIKGITALTRVGVVFTDAQKAQIKALVQSGDVMGAQKIILAEMKTEFGGAAAAAGDTFAGAVFRAKDKVQDFTRNLVTELQPILLAIGKTIGELYTKFLAPLFGWLSKNKEAVALFAGIILTAVAAFKIYQITMAAVTAVQELYIVGMALAKGAKLADIAATEGQTGAMALLNAVMNANPIALVVVAVAALAAGFVIAWNHSETFRKVVITAFQGVLSGVSFAIRALAMFVDFAGKYLILPFKALLGALSALPGVGKYAKAALNFIDDLPANIGKAADAVDSFSTGLDKLQDKKISIPGFGGTKKTDSGTPSGAAAPTGGGGISKEAAAKIKAQEKALTKLKDDAEKIYGKMNDVIKTANEKRTQIEKDYADKKAKLNSDELEKELKLRAEYAQKATDLETKAAQDRAAIIQKGQDMLRSAFATGAKFDLAKMFDDSDKSGAGLLQKLKDKFTAIKKLQAQAGALASAGFSQTFIQEVIAQGPDMGGAMADAILKATPDTKSQLQELYYGLEDVSKHGLDTLAAQMSNSTSFATEELLKEYQKVGIDLADALDKNQYELNDKIKTLQIDLQSALMEAQTNYNDAIDALTKDTMDKLSKLQDELRKTADEMVKLNAQSLAVSTMANSPAAPYLAKIAPIPTSPNKPYNERSGFETTYITNVTGINLADPNASAKAIANATAFGTPQAITPSVNIASLRQAHGGEI